MMFNRLSEWLIRISTGRNILLLALAFLVFSLALFPWWQSQIESAGAIVDSLDLQFGISVDETYRILDNYGDAGRKIYMFGEIILDGLFPLIYSLLLATLLTHLLGRALPKKHGFQRLHIFPFTILILDYTENAGIITLLITYPTRLASLASLTSVLTQIKWILVGFSGLLLILAALGALIKQKDKG